MKKRTHAKAQRRKEFRTFAPLRLCVSLLLLPLAFPSCATSALFTVPESKPKNGKKSPLRQEKIATAALPHGDSFAYHTFNFEGVVRRGLTKFDSEIIDAHKQRYGMSCIPSSVEMVLKLEGRVPGSFHDLQTAWKGKSDGSFKDFDGKTFAGVTFHQQFALPRNRDFPLDKAFSTIHAELEAGRYVIAGLSSPDGWHNWVIYDEDADREFLAVSKFGATTIEERHVKRVITKMQGTDIGTYELQIPNAATAN